VVVPEPQYQRDAQAHSYNYSSFDACGSGGFGFGPGADEDDGSDEESELSRSRRLLLACMGHSRPHLAGKCSISPRWPASAQLTNSDGPHANVPLLHASP
jgi:hypothetical protein